MGRYTEHFWRWQGKGAPGKEGGYGALMRRVAELRAALSIEDPENVASRAGATYRASHEGKGEMRITLWGKEIAVSVPGYAARDASTGKESDPGTQALIMYYLSMSDGASLEGSWVSFSELRDGLFYQKAFQGYTGDSLARAFGNDLEAFGRAARALGGNPEPLGDAAYSFRPLPRVPLAAVYWQGDSEFGPSARVLFDASVNHYLPTDVCAVLGAALTRRLIRAR